MNSPAIVVVDCDPAARDTLERALRGRYASDYTIACLGSADEALAALERMEDEGAPVALVLAAHELAGTSGGDLLERAGQLHPHAKRALLAPWPATGDRLTARAIYDAMALGRMDYYALKPATPSDELFHAAISSFLLEWSKGRHSSPHTVHVIGETWSGRAYELRDTLQRCAAPHAFHLAESESGRELLAQVDEEVGLPLMILPDGQVLVDPSDLEIAHAVGGAIDPDHAEFDLVVVGAGPAGIVGGGDGRLRGLAHARGRLGRPRRPGELQLPDPQLPGLPSRRQRRPARQPRLRPGVGLRRGLHVHAASDRARAGRRSARPDASAANRPCAPGPWCSPPGPSGAGSASRRSRR